MKDWMTRLLLCLSGALLMFIGISVVVDPAAFAAANGIALPNDPSLLSEVRAPAGLVVAGAMFILFSAVRTTYRRHGLALSALIYGSYGIARLVGIALDGLPSASLTQAMIIELFIGMVSLVAVVRLAQQSTAGRR